jgi:hypothetical protein
MVINMDIEAKLSEYFFIDSRIQANFQRRRLWFASIRLIANNWRNKRKRVHNLINEYPWVITKSRDSMSLLTWWPLWSSDTHDSVTLWLYNTAESPPYPRPTSPRLITYILTLTHTCFRYFIVKKFLWRATFVVELKVIRYCGWSVNLKICSEIYFYQYRK